MRIDVIIATHDRAAFLEPCVRSVLASGTELDIEFTITIVDNASSDETPRAIERLMAESGGCVRGLREPRLGKSFAVNTALASTTGEVIALMDDDQIAGGEWLWAIHRTIAEGFDFVTGPVFGRWEVIQPPWYDARLRGVLSLFDGGDRRFSLDEREAFFGGNAALTRAALDRVGGFHTALGKVAGTFSMCEDCELLLRLKRAGLRGAYDPAMRVDHRVPAERVHKAYFRRWHRGYGHSMALMQSLHPLPVPRLLGVPRFLLRRAIEAAPRMLAARWRGDLPGAFEQELNLWFLLGYLGAKIRMRSPDPASESYNHQLSTPRKYHETTDHASAPTIPDVH
jgi:glycosyltransferase involved in cell wall biosynthesis